MTPLQWDIETVLSTNWDGVHPAKYPISEPDFEGAWGWLGTR